MIGKPSPVPLAELRAVVAHVRALECAHSHAKRSTSRTHIWTYAAFLLILLGSIRAGAPRAYLHSSPGPNQESRMRTLQNLGVVSSIALTASVATAQNAVQWRVEDGGNGHWYAAVMPTGSAISWDDADAECARRGGYLASITSSAENAIVAKVAADPLLWTIVYNPPTFCIGPWLGGSQPVGAVEPAGGWSWVTGEPWEYQNWYQGFATEPNDGCGGEDYLHYLTQGATTPSALWNDGGGPLCAPWPKSFVIEYSADCNNDGIVDYGQLLNGTLVDVNGNGVPDVCESTLLVPSQYPTIQGAINAVPAGAHRTVEVAAGTYHESFALNGKDVIIRGAANNATILDGTGLAGSIARFTGGEPSTAGLENLVFRNGTTGSRFTPDATFTIGGAIYANNTAAFIRNCRFENCRADFGGAIYQLTGSIVWDNCVFAGNIANIDGGGALTYNCSGTLRNCTFAGNRCGMNGAGSGSGYKAVGSNGPGESVTIDSCAFTGNIAGDSGSAIEFYEHVKYHPGVLHVVNTTVTGNVSGEPTASGAGGLRVLGQQSSCVLGVGTAICQNARTNVSGPYFVAGAATICDCLADLSGDGFVNGADLGLLLSAWGPTNANGTGDVDHNGNVDGADLAIMLSSWGICQ